MLIYKVPLLGVNKRDLILRGLFGTAAIFGYFTTLQNLPMATAVVIQQLSPLFAVIIAALFFKERSNYSVYILFMFCLLGIVIIKGFEGVFSIYVILGLSSAFLSACAYNFVRKLRTTDHPLVVLSYFQYILLPACLLGFLFKGGEGIHVADIKSISILVVASFLAQLCLTLAFQKALVSKVSSFGFLSIPGSVLIGYFFFDELMDLKQLLGISIIFVSIFLNQMIKDVKNRSNPKKLNNT